MGESLREFVMQLPEGVPHKRGSSVGLKPRLGSKSILEQQDNGAQRRRSGVLLFDQNLNLLGANPAAEELFGISAGPGGSSIGRSVFDVIPGAEQAGLYDRFCQVLKTGQGFITDHVSLRSRSGQATLSIEASKVANCIAVVAWDSTVYLWTEKALADSEEWHRALVDAAGKAGLGIEIVQNTPELEAAIVFVNDEYCNMLGYSREELLRMSEWDLIAPAELSVIRDRYWRRQRGENVIGFYETTLVRKDGSLLPIATSVSTMIYKGQVSSVSYFRDITEQKRVNEQLGRSYEQLRQLSAHLQSVREEEGKRIAREVHDNVGQILTALKMDLSWLSRRLPEDQPALLEKAKSISKLTDTAIQAVRKVSAALRPRLLDELGLAAAIEWQLEELHELASIKTEFTSNMKDLMLDQDRAIAIFRICQESLWNVARHAGATKVRVILSNTGTEIVLKVRDDGIGITQEKITDPKSFGLTGMRERAAFWGGKVKISGTTGKGTVVTVTIPVDEKEKSSA